MNDPLAELLCRMWDGLHSHDGRWKYEVEAFAPEAAWLRSHRDELLTALGGSEHHGAIELPRSSYEKGGLTVRYPLPGESVWVFGEDA